MRFSATTLSFYPKDLDYGDSLPKDCVDVSQEIFQYIIKAPEGKSRSADKDGQPILIDTPVYVPTWEEEVAEREQTRKTLITEVDAISSAKWYGFSENSKITISAYRKNLEALNVEASKVVWPTKPKEL